jgi:flagellar biosynthetic protein FliR
MSNLVGYYVLLLARVGFFVGVLPVFGGTGMPRLVRVGLVLVLTWFWGATLTANPALAGWLGRPLDVSWLTYGLALGREALLGALTGFAFGLFMVPARVAGEYISQEMGISFGNLLNPTGEITTGSVTPIFDLFSTLVFLALEVHHLLLATFQAGLTRTPLGAAWPPPPVQDALAAANAVQEWGLVLVAPIAVCLFLATVVLAVMARVAPLMNIYAVGFPLRLVVGMIALMVLFPDMLAALATAFGRVGELLGRLV